MLDCGPASADGSGGMPTELPFKDTGVDTPWSQSRSPSLIATDENDDSVEAGESSVQPRDCRSVCQTVWRGVAAAGKLCLGLVKFCCLRLDKISLFILYVAGLAKVDLIHSGYVVFCLLFFIFPKLSRLAWAVLLIYIELALLALYLWQFRWIGERASSEPFIELLGLQFDATCTEVVDVEKIPSRLATITEFASSGEP